eukprot:6194907-Pleurochrysis_carterae.AAC.1
MEPCSSLRAAAADAVTCQPTPLRINRHRYAPALRMRLLWCRVTPGCVLCASRSAAQNDEINNVPTNARNSRGS